MVTFPTTTDAMPMPDRSIRVAETAYNRLEHLIVTLKLAPGAITTEGFIIDLLQLGRTPVREAIQQLAWEGLMDVRPRAGVAIAPLNAGEWLKITDARHGLETVQAKSAARFVSASASSLFHFAAVNMQRSVVANDIDAYLD